MNYSGIYCIQNTQDSKKYIGSSKNVNRRWTQQHLPLLRAAKHYNIHLQRAWQKYGENNFRFAILEECDIDSLASREGHWIEYFKSWDRACGYNLVRYIDNRIIRYDQELHEQIILLFKSGISKNGIAKRMHISRNCVYFHLEEEQLHQNTGRGNEVKLTNETKEHIRKLRNEGNSWQEIIEATGVSRTQLYRTNNAGTDDKYQTHKVNRQTYRTVTPEVVFKVESLRAKGMTWEQIEVEVGVSRFALHQNGVTQNLKQSRKGEAKKKITLEIRAEILRLYSEGHSITAISDSTGIAKSTIRLQIKNENAKEKSLS